MNQVNISSKIKDHKKITKDLSMMNLQTGCMVIFLNQLIKACDNWQ